jgi:hypothetical protein
MRDSDRLLKHKIQNLPLVFWLIPRISRGFPGNPYQSAAGIRRSRLVGRCDILFKIT